jgi:hypothetical protein
MLMNSFARLPIPVLALLIALLCAGVYAPGLSGGFVLDDLPTITQNAALATLHPDSDANALAHAAISSSSGLLRRPISMLSFALTVRQFGLNPFAFKSVNLLIHLLNGLLVFLLCQRLLMRMLPPQQRAGSAQGLAMLAALLWLLHPMHVSSVLYVVQRMTELASLFTLGGLLCYMKGRDRMLRGQDGLILTLGGLMLFGLLAVFSKENGALIVFYALVIEAVMYRFQADTPALRRTLQAFFLLSCLLPVLTALPYVLTDPDWTAIPYSRRGYTLGERLLSECRAIFHYLLWILLPLPQWLGLYHDDFAASKGFLSPPGTAVAVVSFITVLGASIWATYRDRWRAFTFAVLWLVAGHLLESTVLPLELVFEHRNYLPTLGIILGLVLLAARLPSGTGRMTLAAAITLALATGTWLRANAWGDPMTLALSEAMHHPNSARANYEAGGALMAAGERNGTLMEGMKSARPYFVQAANADERYASREGLLLTYVGEASVPADVVANLEHHLRKTWMPPPNTVLSVIRANLRGDLALSTEQTLGLVTAALDNPSIHDEERALIMDGFAEYQFKKLGNSQEAVSLTLTAVALAPENPLLRVNLANLALALNQPDIAEEAVTAAERLDRYGLFTEDIRGIREQLVRAR